MDLSRVFVSASQLIGCLLLPQPNKQPEKAYYFLLWWCHNWEGVIVGFWNFTWASMSPNILEFLKTEKGLKTWDMMMFEGYSEGMCAKKIHSCQWGTERRVLQARPLNEDPHRRERKLCMQPYLNQTKWNTEKQLNIYLNERRHNSFLQKWKMTYIFFNWRQPQRLFNAFSK